MSKAGRALGGAASGAASGFTVGGPIGGAIGGIIGGIGGLFGGGDAEEEEAKRLRNEALKELQGVSLPTIEELQMQYQTLSSQGLLTPELEQSIAQQASELQNISSDPRLKDAEMSALTKLMDTGNDGLSAQDRMRINDTRRTMAGDARAQDEAIMQNMAARGAGGSGVELAQRLASSQAQADRASGEGDRIAAMANQQALEAIMKSGQLGGDIRAQDFGEAAKKAEAQDIINRFNTANQQSVMSSNVGYKNQAQLANLREAQRIADSNVGTQNQQNLYNRGVIADDYERKLNKARVLSGATQGAANAAQASADRSNSEFGGVVSGIKDTIVGGAQSGMFGGTKAKVAPSGSNFDMDADNTEANFKKPVFGTRKS